MVSPSRDLITTDITCGITEPGFVTALMISEIGKQGVSPRVLSSR